MDNLHLSENIPDYYDIKTSGGIPGSDSKVQIGLFVVVGRDLLGGSDLLAEVAVLSAFTMSRAEPPRSKTKQETRPGCDLNRSAFAQQTPEKSA